MNILTFDVEEWWHILNTDKVKPESRWMEYESRIHCNLDRILDLLEQNNQKATFFCLGWIADKHPDIIKAIHSRGHNIGVHSYSHSLIYQQDADGFRNDLNKSLQILENIIGEKVKIYRAPGCSLNSDCNWVFNELIEAGIEIDCSIFPGKRAHGGYKTFKKAEPVRIDYKGHMIKEFPINRIGFLHSEIIFSGGGYFRFIPYTIIKLLMMSSPYVMTYFHPRDFDPDQPIIDNLPLMRRFRHYYGLHTAFDKLRKYINDYNFIDIEAADNSINWDDTPIVKLV